MASLVQEHSLGGINDPVLERRCKALAWQRLLPIKGANEDQKVLGAGTLYWKNVEHVMS